MKPITVVMFVGVLLVSHTVWAQDTGVVSMPLAEWENMLEALKPAEPEQSTVPACRLSRSISGSFSKGLFEGILVERFEVLAPGHVQVPVLFGAVSLGEVRLDGKQTTLVKEGDAYAVSVTNPGVYEVRLKFYFGEDQDRFARRLKFRLPAGGITRVSVFVPEREIEARLPSGVLTRQETRPGGTQLEGYLDAKGVFDLYWTRRAATKGARSARTEAVVSALFTIGEALTSGVAVFDVSVLEGETDVLELDLPPGIEVLRVEGEAVLQWATEAGDSGGRLKVLLRYLVPDRTRVAVHFQAPADPGGEMILAMPHPAEGTVMSGAAGVQAPAGLGVSVSEVQRAVELPARELPTTLTDLTKHPLKLGFQFTEPPEIRVRVSRLDKVELTSTVVEEIQASTVFVEDGTEVTKAKFRVRNNTKEYLEVRLPDGAVLTHSLLEGLPVRPAVSEDENGAEILLFPLRQSERFDEDNARFHVVRQGETLSDISNLYYSSPAEWEVIVDANKDVLAGTGVTMDQRLRIPAKSGTGVEESSFVIELAYKLKRGELGPAGRVDVWLPEVDVDTLRVTWHLYFPSFLDPLRFDSNLTQYTAIRYDPFRRVEDFIERALWLDWAWAGGEYRNILAERKGIYREEKVGGSTGEMVRSAFPLVGSRYQFRRILLGQETPQIRVTYLERHACTAAGILALLISAGLTLLVVRRPRRVSSWVVAAVGLVGLLVLAHYVLGVHRRILWGMDLVLIGALLRMRATNTWATLLELVRSPWRVVRLITFRNLLLLVFLLVVLSLMIAYPLLLSSLVFVLFLMGLKWYSRQAATEVEHA